MTDLSKEEVLNRRLEHDRPGRDFISVEGSRWGELIQPSVAESSARNGTGMRILAVTSFLFGSDVLDAFLDYERANPGASHLVAVATDDAINADAKIGLKKRLWKDYSQTERVAIEVDTVEKGLLAGVPVYTGELKIDWFYRQLQKWNPDAIVVCVCGQIFSSPIFDFPRFGAYNFHPADLASGHGAGPQFLEDNIARNDPWTRWTVHHMTQTVDGGPIVGRSPPILLADTQGQILTDPKRAYEKLRPALHPMVTTLVAKLGGLFCDDKGGVIESLDFEQYFPEQVRENLRQPVN
ncbi:MAG: formyltransferase family protein [Pseudomonadota bacterium]